MKKITLLWLSCMFSLISGQKKMVKALVISPVADLLGSPITDFGLARTTKKSYELLPLCGVSHTASISCPRIHQALYNETVYIENSPHNSDAEACLTLPSAFFITTDVSQPQNKFWTRSDNLISYETLKKYKVPLEYIPDPISFKEPYTSTKPTLILTLPFFDPHTCQRFSAGTRFVYDPAQTTDKHYTIWLFDAQAKKCIITQVDKSKARVEKRNNSANAIKTFLTTLKKWVSLGSKSIHYVWGGSSFTYASDTKPNEMHFTLKNKKQTSAFTVKKKNKEAHAGFDCAGLVLRAAQIAGIPYFFKNTYTLAHFLKPLGPGETIEAGDLLWIPGHVIVLNDTQKNNLIEARGYSHGYGKVQEIPLEQEFKNVHTYQELADLYHHKKPLVRLNKKGEEIETISQYKILKLKSAWDTIKT